MWKFCRRGALSDWMMWLDMMWPDATYADKTTFVRDVVCQLQLVEGDHLENLHQIFLFYILADHHHHLQNLHAMYIITITIITFCIQCSPVAGLSGWMYIRFGISGSAFPATIHWLEIQFWIFNWKFYWQFLGGIPFPPSAIGWIYWSKVGMELKMYGHDPQAHYVSP